ncbi:serine/arginine-rich splicing factor 2-like isoform X1 [Pecten maximus]|uniref:serine/arginine-rich splicing factor 2-like isoform X1 n=1 Tax=Pecten maximus TaxID=6579 RepID=UPI001457FDB8|nr:serine/arginine-rich splicing factor 2-like isoform X1 [Pecten maximus]
MSYGRGPPDIEGMASLKVDNLTYRTTPEDLRRAFEKYGDVGDVYIPRDRFTRESRGFAFVRYYDKRDAEDALDSMDGAIMDGRELRVQMARYGRPNESHRSRAPPRRSYGYGRSRRSRSRSRSRSRGRRSRSRSRRRRSRSRSRSHSRSRSYSRSHSRSKSASRSRSRSRDVSKSPSRSPGHRNHDDDCGDD